jgi:hypothetical protein
VIVRVRPPITSAEVRAAPVVLTAAVNETVPGPVPPGGETVSQPAPLAAVHAHPAEVVTLTVPDPPAAGTDWVLDARL